MRTLAIIPARGGSKRIPRKNIKNFLGVPIIHYSLKAANHSNLFDEVMVSTDDDEIADLAQFFGARVPFMRSPENSSDHATTVDVLIEVLENYKKKGIHFTHACCIYPSAPLTSPDTLRKGYNKMIANDFDSVIPVMKFSYPIHRALNINEEGNIKMAMPEHVNTRTQDLPDAYHDTGQFYWFNVKELLKQKTLFTKNSGSIVLKEYEAQDIDTEEDWQMAELKFKLLNRNNENKNIFPRRCA
jgi:pseudaminic acid cytidylyltransferase